MSKGSGRAEPNYSDPAIRYRVMVENPDAHRFELLLEIDAPDPGGQCLSLPNWIPGSYMIRDFSRHVLGIDIESAGEPLPLEKLDKSRWRAPPGLDSLRVRYRLHARDASVREAWLDRDRAFFNGTSVFLRVEGQEHRCCTVELVPPVHDAGADWRVATAMRPVSLDAQGFGTYRAADYDELIDHPVEMGAFERVEFDVAGVPHELVLAGRYVTDAERIARDLARTCQAHVSLFGGPPPFERYVFLVAVTDRGYGGLEHRASTALVIGRDALPIPGDDRIEDRYLEFLGLCSHEYFHVWNVKRIRPAAFVPLDLDREVYTRLLWFFEGVTSYYDDLALVRAGLIDAKRYRSLLEKTLTQVHRGAGRRRQSVAASSFDAWHRFYKQDANAGNAIVSYYTKGALIALCLDATLRARSDGAVSLDDLMRRLWSDYLDAGERYYRGVGERDPERIAETLVDADLSSFFHIALDTPDELPLAEAFEQLGVRLHWRRRRSAEDTGGAAADEAGDRPWFGAALTDEAAGPLVRTVANDGPAERAGLAPGDRLIAMARLAVATAELERLLARHASHESIEVHWLRAGRLLEGSLPIELPPVDTAVLETIDNARFEDWTGSTA